MTAFERFRDSLTQEKPKLAFVLGSGMSDVPSGFVETTSISFSDVPELTASTVVGHSARIALGTCAGRTILIFRGRLHFYEGHTWQRVGRPVGYAAEWGIKHLILTNAAGGIRADLNPGCLMALSGHFGWLNPEAWKPLETKSPSPYSRRLLDLISGFDSSIQTGIYASVTGPCYETPAEIGALKAAGADAVGMSTAHEVDTAHRLGLEVGAISLITNRAAGITGEKLSHREVLETAKRQENRLSQLIESLCSQI